jgi:dihydroneopterin aldolase
MEIFLDNLEFVGPHGVYEEEQREGRRFEVDLSVECERPDGTETDTLEDTIDYRGLAEIVLEVGTGPSRHLIERLGDEMLERIFERFPTVRSAELTLRKYATGVPGSPECVGIRTTRTRRAES